jgi:pimeloyl-ACP methyl ester carboxylesterase
VKARIRGARHWPHWDEPETVNAAIKAFIER